MFIKIFAVILIASPLAFSEQRLIVDPDFSPYMGSYDLLTSHFAVQSLQDRLHIRNRGRDTTLNTWGRMLNQFGFILINGLADVTQHEVFGHGYRLRDLNKKIIGYKIAPFEGHTAFELENSTPLGEMLAIVVAGLEAEGILAQKAKFQFLNCGSIDGRMATLFTQAQLSNFWYSLGTYVGDILDQIEQTPSNDIHAYQFFLNTTYPSDPISLKELSLWSAASWLDPMIYYAFFSWFYYIAQNEPLCVPMIPLTETIYYLPNIRSEFAPYGPELYLENHLIFCDKLLYFYLKGGKHSFGIGLIDHCIFSGPWGKIGLHIDGWIYKQFETEKLTLENLENQTLKNPCLKKNVYGISASLTATCYLSETVGLFAELGGKTAGFLTGYTLDSGAIVRAGLSIKTF